VVGTGDFNGDGFGDILWRDSAGDLAVWLMNGATVMDSAALGSVPGTWSIVGTGDFNGDGKTDILWQDTSGDLAIWFMDGEQVVGSAMIGTVTSNFQVQGIGDFNGDGYGDILWRDTNSGTISIWFINSPQVTSTGVVGTLPSGWKVVNVVQIGDYNGDGMSDLLLLDSAGDVFTWLMNGATVSQALTIGNVGTTWTVQGVNAD
jgi:FG-GAP-like repeat